MTNGGESSTGEDSHLLSNSSHHSQPSNRLLGEDVPLYSRPRQRQRWGDEQILPHVNWGDLYIDLFYVAAAYNLGVVIKHSPNWEGVVYFACCYFPSAFIWNEKVLYDSRFAPEDNLFHRGLELFHLVLLGTIVSHIRDVSLMKMTCENSITMIFAGALFLDCWCNVRKYFDVVHNVEGGSEAKLQALDDAYRKMFVGVFYFVALALAGRDFFGQHNLEGNNLPIIFCLIGSLSEHLYILVGMYIILPARNVNHHDVHVPMNLEFTLHRLAEWVMLMLGESILSLLIVEITGTIEYYITFFSGIVAVTMLQYLYYRSNPHDPKDHAMRRSTVGGFVFWYSMMLYSASLILVGVSYKMMLTVYFEEAEAEEVEAEEQHRILHLPLPFNEYKQVISEIYGYALSASLFLLDMMLFAHRGLSSFEAFISRQTRVQASLQH